MSTTNVNTNTDRLTRAQAALDEAQAERVLAEEQILRGRSLSAQFTALLGSWTPSK